MLTATYIIDAEKYGMKTEFSSLDEAQQAIRDCGPEFAATVLSVMGVDAIYDQDGDCIGRLEY